MPKASTNSFHSTVLTARQAGNGLRTPTQNTAWTWRTDTSLQILQEVTCAFMVERAAIPTSATLPHWKLYPVNDCARRDTITESENEFDAAYIEPFDNPTTADTEENTTKEDNERIDDKWCRTHVPQAFGKNAGNPQDGSRNG